MTTEQRKEDDVLRGYAMARKGLVDVQNALADAAEHCRGTELETVLNEAWDRLEDLRFDLFVSYNAYMDSRKEAAAV